MFTGHFVPPMLIYPRKNTSALLAKGAPAGTLIRVHPSGWVQTHLFTEWFQMFIQMTNPSEESPVLLILDGHYSHTRNIDVIILARENHVVIISLPPHTTHRLQPLDRTYMGSFKTHYSEAIRIFIQSNERVPNHYDISELFGKAFVECQNASIAINGFRVTGICPFNRTIFDESAFIAEKHAQTKSANKETNSAVTSIGSPNVCNVNNDVTISFGIRNDSINLQQSANVSTNTTDSPSTNDEPSAHVSPQDIYPVPKVRKNTSNRGPKGTSAALITGSPYKADLEASIKRIEGRDAANRARNRGTRGRGSIRGRISTGTDAGTSGVTRGRGKTRGRGAQKACGRLGFDENIERDSSPSSDSSESLACSLHSSLSDLNISVGELAPLQTDAVRIFCCESYSSDRPGELWVQCVVCENWAHSACTDCETDSYICDYCKDA